MREATRHVAVTSETILTLREGTAAAIALAVRAAGSYYNATSKGSRVHRLFVAIRPPRPMREALLVVMGGVPGARWQDDAQLHLTLRYIGEVDGHVADDIAAGLEGIRNPTLAIGVDGVGQFDHRGRLEALWARVVPPGPLAALHRKIDQALVRLGLPPEGRAYLPHITLARFGRLAGDPHGFLAQSLVCAPQEIDQFFLYESQLGREGSTYTIVARYRLIA